MKKITIIIFLFFYQNLYSYEIIRDQVFENYLKELESFVNEIKSACAKNEVDYVLVNTKDPVEKTISDYLLRRTAMAKSR